MQVYWSHDFMKKVDYIDEKFNVAKYIFAYICRGIILHGYFDTQKTYFWDSLGLLARIPV